MGWRDYAEQVQRERDNRDDRDKTPVSAPIVPNVPNVPGAVASGRLREWTRALMRLDPCKPREGFSMDRWQTLYDCSVWLVESFGEQAAHEGWSTGDLFGIFPPRERWGGLVDNLGDARSLVMSGKVATWRSFGVKRIFYRTGGTHLEPFWSVGAASKV